jgi:hypothetical protein
LNVVTVGRNSTSKKKLKSMNRIALTVNNAGDKFALAVQRRPENGISQRREMTNGGHSSSNQVHLHPFVPW